MMPQRFLLLGRAFNETVFLGLDRGPWFYSPTRAKPHLKLIYIYTAVLVKIYLKFKFADECFDLSTNGILPFFIELSPFSTNFSLFVPNSYNSVYKICVPFTFRKLVFLLFLFFFIIRRYRVCQKETSNMLTAEPLFCLKHCQILVLSIAISIF